MMKPETQKKLMDEKFPLARAFFWCWWKEVDPYEEVEILEEMMYRELILGIPPA